MSVAFSWNLVDDVQQLLSYHFMLNALRAGTIVAVVCGAIGYFMVLRRQSFVGHTLAVIGFPGAAGATWLGISTGFGYYGLCVAGALVIAMLPGAGRGGTGLGGAGEESAVVGTVQGFALACGFLFVTQYKGFLSGLTGLLFGTITGVSDTQVIVLLISGVCVLAVLAVGGRVLLFASVDPDVARARGVSVRLVGTGFLLLLAVAVAGASQITGSLLVFALLVAPAATAARLTARPGAGVVLSVTLAVAVTWLGEALAFFTPYPIGFWVTTLAFGAYVLATAAQTAAQRLGRRVVIA